jgi:hypothetical protein
MESGSAKSTGRILGCCVLAVLLLGDLVLLIAFGVTDDGPPDDPSRYQVHARVLLGGGFVFVLLAAALIAAVLRPRLKRDMDDWRAMRQWNRHPEGRS